MKNKYTFVFEISDPFQKIPGYVKNEINGKKSLRVWWLWFAIAFYRISLMDLCEGFQNGKFEWRQD